MQDIPAIIFLEAIIETIEKNGKSASLSDFLARIEVPAPGELNDFVTELSLTAHPDEEDGVGCIPIDKLRSAFTEVRETGATRLLSTLN